MIIKKKRAEIAQMIAQNSNWRNIGLYFEHKNFAISEAYLKAKCGEYQPSLNLCEQLIEELASRNISTEVLINVLREPNIGMNNIADNVAAIASNNDYLCTLYWRLLCIDPFTFLDPSEAHAWSSIGKPSIFLKLINKCFHPHRRSSKMVNIIIPESYEYRLKVNVRIKKKVKKLEQIPSMYYFSFYSN